MLSLRSSAILLCSAKQRYIHFQSKVIAINGRNRTADTVIYEKEIGEKSYYVVQAVPDTKAKTLYIVTAFIGKKGYKKEAPQLINAKGLDVTAKTGSADASVNSISHNSDSVNRDFSDSDEIRYSDREIQPITEEEYFVLGSRQSDIFAFVSQNANVFALWAKKEE